MTTLSRTSGFHFRASLMAWSRSSSAVAPSDDEELVAAGTMQPGSRRTTIPTMTAQNVDCKGACRSSKRADRKPFSDKYRTGARNVDDQPAPRRVRTVELGARAFGIVGRPTGVAGTPAASHARISAGVAIVIVLLAGCFDEGPATGEQSPSPVDSMHVQALPALGGEPLVSVVSDTEWYVTALNG